MKFSDLLEFDYSKAAKDFAFNALRVQREETKKYYMGFNYKRGNMYQNEMNDLEKIYKEQLQRAEDEMDGMKSIYVHYMQQFIDLVKKQEDLREKLKDLQDKISYAKEQEEDKRCHRECC